MVRHNDIERISDGLVLLKLMIGRRVIGKTAMANQSTMMEVTALDALSAVPHSGAEQGIKINDIARVLRVDQSRASRIVTSLEELHLVERKPSPTDARCSMVQCTSQGDKLLAEVAQLRAGVIQDVVGEWEDAECAAFSDLLARFLTGLEIRLSRMEQR